MSDDKKSREELLAELEALRARLGDEAGEPPQRPDQGEGSREWSRREALGVAWTAPVILSLPLSARASAQESQLPSAPAVVRGTPAPTGPTKTPTSAPTQSPTSYPSKAPTIAPSAAPSAAPSLAPTFQPPTNKPTMMPTLTTLSPTLPTSFPTIPFSPTPDPRILEEDFETNDFSKWSEIKTRPTAPTNPPSPLPTSPTVMPTAP